MSIAKVCNSKMHNSGHTKARPYTYNFVLYWSDVWIKIFNSYWYPLPLLLIYTFVIYLFSEVCNKDSDCMNLGMCLPNKTCKCKVHFDDGFRCISSGNLTWLRMHTEQYLQGFLTYHSCYIIPLTCRILYISYRILSNRAYHIQFCMLYALLCICPILLGVYDNSQHYPILSYVYLLISNIILFYFECIW